MLLDAETGQVMGCTYFKKVCMMAVFVTIVHILVNSLTPLELCLNFTYLLNSNHKIVLGDSLHQRYLELIPKGNGF